jgi:serine/threonine protein kinase
MTGPPMQNLGSNNSGGDLGYCPTLVRFWEVAAGGSWESAELRHVAHCPGCTHKENEAKAALAGDSLPSSVLRGDLVGSTPVLRSQIGELSDHLDRLLLLWDEHCQRGRDLAAEESCADCLGLVAELRRRIEALRTFDTHLQSERGMIDLASMPVDQDGDGAVANRGLPGHLRATDIYRIQQFHAHGGLGEVLCARQDELARNVAVKRIRPDKLRDASRRRFLREAVITARLQHPGIVPIYSLGRDDDDPFYTMPFIQGETLQEAITAFHGDESLSRDPGRWGLWLRVLLQRFITVCNTMAYAHDQGIVHRDLKPSNIMLGQYGETLVMDWGLAKRLGSDEDAAEDAVGAPSPGPLSEENTSTGEVLGTPRYMSPEQTTGQPVGPASDLYSLGVILYTVLTGKPPYREASPEDLLQPVREGAVVPPRARDKRISRALEAICQKAMSVRPDDRYPSARAMADDITAWLADEPVSAYPEPWSFRSRRWIGRHRTLILVGAIGLLLATAIAVGERERLRELVNEARVGAVALAGEGRFDEAAEKLARAIREIRKRPLRFGALNSIERQQDLYLSMGQFGRSSDTALFCAGEERGAEALDACHVALGCYGVLESPDWARNLAKAGLPHETIATVETDVHRILVLKAALHLEAGILAHVRSDRSGVETSSNLASQALQRAGELEGSDAVPPSVTRALLQRGAFRLLRLKNGEGTATLSVPSAVAAAATTPPDGLTVEDLTAEDSFLLGILHVYRAKHADDAIGLAIKLLSLSAVDTARPRDTALAMLRRAVFLEPWQYWSNFMLGRILAIPDPQSGRADYAEAMLAFNNCISLRRDYSRGYEQRALTLALLSTDPTEVHRRESLRQRALAELARTIVRPTDDPSTHWVRGQTYELLGRTEDAMVAYTLALECERDLQVKVSRRNELDRSRALAERVLKARPTDPAAERLSELIDRASNP